VFRARDSPGDGQKPTERGCNQGLLYHAVFPTRRLRFEFLFLRRVGNGTILFSGQVGISPGCSMPVRLDLGRVMILLIDNYDSFTYNLVQRLGEIDPGIDLQVFRNDQITVDEIEALSPSHLIISPGPCTPLEAGISNDLIRRLAPRIPLLGVCLGHQAIGAAFWRYFSGINSYLCDR